MEKEFLKEFNSWVVALGFVAAIVEMLWYLGKKDAGYDIKSALASLAEGIGSRFFPLILPMYFLVNLPVISTWEYRLFTIESSPVSLFILFLMVDLSYYWEHRLAHTIRWFWTSHEVHHTTEQLTLADGGRVSWTGPLVGLFVFRLPLVFVGFDPNWVFAITTWVSLYQFFVHVQWFPKVPFLDAFMATPSNHRVHHAKALDMQSKNYGGVLIVWDRLFGTYVPEPEQRFEYGLKGWRKSYNPLVMPFEATWRMFRDAWRSLRRGHPLLAVDALLGYPTDPTYGTDESLGSGGVFDRLDAKLVRAEPARRA